MIDTSMFEYKDSRWQDIFTYLKKSGFDVYSPGMKTGECTSPYVVVKNDGSSKHASFSTDTDFYAVMCYVPRDAYSKLEPMIQSVKKAMKELEPMLFPCGTQSPSYYDDTYKAHMISIEYKNYKKL